MPAAIRPGRRSPSDDAAASELAPPPAWEEANQAYLAAALAALKQRLGAPAAAPPRLLWPAPLAGRPPALLRLARLFGLSAFETDLLLLCAGIELDAEVASLCAAVQGDAARPWPSFGLALAVLPAAHWSALVPDAPLRRWRLLEVGGGVPLTQAPLRIDERVLHHLAGVDHLDERLAGVVRRLDPPAALSPSHAAIARRLAATWHAAGTAPPLVQLCGAAADGLPVAAAAARAIGTGAALLDAALLPAAPAELGALLTLWRREALLSDLGVLAIDADATDAEEGRSRAATLAHLIEAAGGRLALCDRQGRRHGRRPAVLLEVRHPEPEEQRAAWDDALGAGGDAIAGQFSLALADIGAVAAEARARDAAGEDGAAAPGAIAWDLCRARLRARMDGLARRVEAKAGWEQLILPAAEMATLHAIAGQLRQRTTVYQRWGFAAQSSRGLGISALFAGPSGTGKTLAAEVLAAAIAARPVPHRSVHRRQQVHRRDREEPAPRVRRRRGRRRGPAVRRGGRAVRQAQRGEGQPRPLRQHRGRAICCSGWRLPRPGDPDDQHEERRWTRRSCAGCASSCEFPFPDAAQRAAIWRRVFPPGDAHRGAGLRAARRGCSVAGGNIRNIALNAAFLAADAGQPVGMAHVLAAARAEYAKLERSLTPSEIAGWV